MTIPDYSFKEACLKCTLAEVHEFIREIRDDIGGILFSDSDRVFWRRVYKLLKCKQEFERR